MRLYAQAAAEALQRSRAITRSDNFAQVKADLTAMIAALAAFAAA